MSLLTRTGITLLCAATLVVQAGCVTPPYQLPPPPTDPVRAHLGTIGVVSARFMPKVEFTLPAKGALAGAGRRSASWAAAGFLGPFEGASGCSGDSSGLCGVLVLSTAVVGGTVGGLVGSLSGAVVAEPAEKVDASEAVLRNCLLNLKVQEAMRDRVVDIAQRRTHHRFTVVTDAGPAGPEETVIYAPLAGEGIRTVLEINIPTYALAGPWEVNPPLRFLLDARVKVVRIADGVELYKAWFRYAGNERRFFDWAADNARAFRAELDLSYTALADEIVDELFLLALVPAPAVATP